MDFLELAKKRFSARAYTSEPVKDEDLQYILEAARIAPSANNKQPWKFIVIREKENLEAVYRLYHREWFRQAPLVIVVLGDHSESWERSQDGKKHTDIDVAIAIDHLTLAAAERGLATCWICNFYVQATREYFRLPPHLEPIAFIPVGYPAQQPDPERHKTKRKPLNEIVYYEKLN